MIFTQNNSQTHILQSSSIFDRLTNLDNLVILKGPILKKEIIERLIKIRIVLYNYFTKKTKSVRSNKKGKSLKIKF